MVDGVHGNTTSLGPRVALHSELMLSPAGLHQGFVRAASAGNNPDHASNGALHDLLRATGELDARLALIRVVSDHGHVVSARPAKRTTVTDLLLHVADHGTLGHASEREHVADGERCVLAGVDELASVHALVGDECLGHQLELVGVAEGDFGEGRTTAGIVDDVLDDTADVAMALSVIEGPELRWGFVQPGVGCEDRAAALPLIANDTTLRRLLVSEYRERMGCAYHLEMIAVDVFVKMRPRCHKSQVPRNSDLILALRPEAAATHNHDSSTSCSRPQHLTQVLWPGQHIMAVPKYGIMMPWLTTGAQNAS